MFLFPFAFPGNGAKNSCLHFLASLPKIDYKSILSNGTRNVWIDIPNHHYVRKVTLDRYDSGLCNAFWY